MADAVVTTRPAMCMYSQNASIRTAHDKPQKPPNPRSPKIPDIPILYALHSRFSSTNVHASAPGVAGTQKTPAGSYLVLMSTSFW